MRKLCTVLYLKYGSRSDIHLSTVYIYVPVKELGVNLGAYCLDCITITKKSKKLIGEAGKFLSFQKNGGIITYHDTPEYSSYSYKIKKR